MLGMYDSAAVDNTSEYLLCPPKIYTVTKIQFEIRGEVNNLIECCDSIGNAEKHSDGVYFHPPFTPLSMAMLVSYNFPLLSTLFRVLYPRSVFQMTKNC